MARSPDARTKEGAPLVGHRLARACVDCDDALRMRCVRRSRGPHERKLELDSPGGDALDEVRQHVQLLSVCHGHPGTQPQGHPTEIGQHACLSATSRATSTGGGSGAPQDRWSWASALL